MVHNGRVLPTYEPKIRPDGEYDRCRRRRRAQSSSTGGGEARDSCDAALV